MTNRGAGGPRMECVVFSLRIRELRLLRDNLFLGARIAVRECRGLENTDDDDDTDDNDDDDAESLSLSGRRENRRKGLAICLPYGWGQLVGDGRIVAVLDVAWERRNDRNEGRKGFSHCFVGGGFNGSVGQSAPQDVNTDGRCRKRTGRDRAKSPGLGGM